MTTYYHCSMTIRPLIEMGREEFCKTYSDRAFTGKDGTPMTANEAYDGLLDALSKGYECIGSSGCDNFSHETGCLGHEDKEKNETQAKDQEPARNAGER